MLMPASESESGKITVRIDPVTRRRLVATEERDRRPASSPRKKSSNVVQSGWSGCMGIGGLLPERLGRSASTIAKATYAKTLRKDDWPDQLA
jgi:hypothetical protein